MNWDALGAIAELVAAVGVIISLVYLAKQIRGNSENISQNTKVLLASTDMSSNETILQIYGAQAGNHKLAELCFKAHLKLESLTPLEQYQYGFFLMSTFESHQTFFVQSQHDNVRPEIWAYYQRRFKDLCQLPGVIDWWKTNRNYFIAEFAEYIDTLLPNDARQGPETANE